MQGNSALHYAVSHGNFDVVSLLLDTGVVDVDLSNRAGYTAIMLASLADVQTDSERTVILRLFQTGNVNLQASQVYIHLGKLGHWVKVIGSRVNTRFHGSHHCDTVNSSYRSDVLNMFLIVFALICCIIFVQ